MTITNRILCSSRPNSAHPAIARGKPQDVISQIILVGGKLLDAITRRAINSDAQRAACSVLFLAAVSLTLIIDCPRASHG